jgi:peptidoglycan-N-acetylglucosamine deacetylase
MRSIRAAHGAAVVFSLVFSGSAASACPDQAKGLGVSRIVEIDASSGPIFGNLTKQTREDSFLGAKEVVLTFDDGPMPGITKSILDTLDRFCTKATFFSVGRMAIAYPAMTKEILTRGHTLGTHTWSHPMNLARMAPAAAREQIDSGFAAVALAADQPIAPFFRFPGLSDSPALMSYLQERGIAAFTVDVVSNDSYIGDVNRLIARTLDHVETNQGGIVLFHDIKHVTARALPAILAELKKRGYKVVHMRGRTPYKPDDKALSAMRDTAQRFARSLGAGAKQTLLAVTDGMSTRSEAPVQAVAVMPQTPKQDSVPVAAIAPLPRDRLAKSGTVVAKTAPAAIDAALPAMAAADKQAQVTPVVQSTSQARPSTAGGVLDNWSALFRRRMHENGG